MYTAVRFTLSTEVKKCFWRWRRISTDWKFDTEEVDRFEVQPS
jgi:hypothetical protein